MICVFVFVGVSVTVLLRNGVFTVYFHLLNIHANKIHKKSKAKKAAKIPQKTQVIFAVHINLKETGSNKTRQGRPINVSFELKAKQNTALRIATE